MKKPQRIGIEWNVWDEAGALQVLNEMTFVEELQADGDVLFPINFANNSYARITPNHPLWDVLREIVDLGYLIEVFPLGSIRYVVWDGSFESPRIFEAIHILKGKK